MRRLISERDQNRTVAKPISQITVEELAVKFLERTRAERQPATHHDYAAMLRKLVYGFPWKRVPWKNGQPKPVPSHVKREPFTAGLSILRARDVTPIEAQEMLNALAKLHRPKTVNNWLIACKACWNWAIRMKLLTENPFQILKPLHAPGRTTLVTKRDRADLRVCLSEWVNRLHAIVDKNDLFNHWDDDDCAGLCDPSTGIGWTARMLEFCRSGGQLRRITTTQPELDLALVVMELNLSISSRNNPFSPGIKDFVKPDGLGIRSDGTFGVLEVKAASDCPELFRATIQALCGAVGVFAKQKLIVDLAKKPRGRRPAAGNEVMLGCR